MSKIAKMTLPLFSALAQFPEESAIDGRLLTGYTAIEYQLCLCTGMGGGDVEKAITELFSRRIGETKRIRVADRFGGSSYASAGLRKEFEQAIDDTRWCVKIRNQYAHCIWHNYADARQLLFAHMEEIAAPTGPGADIANLTFYAVDVDLLTHQEAFFFYVKDNLNYLNHMRRQLTGDIGSGANLRVPTLVVRPKLNLGLGLI
jgi:hypothetical protein